jgi:hypothetical protein
MAKARGCRHYRSRYGTPGQCSDCPAAKLATVAVPQASEAARPSAGTVAVRERALDGDQLLKDAYTALKHFAVWPSEAALVTAVLWAAQAHARGKDGTPVWQYSPRLFFTSREGGSGKSWMARLVAKLSPDGKMLVEATKASLVRLLAKQATIVVTELDVLVGNGGRNKWFTGIANAGYERDQSTYRVDHGKELEIPLMSPMVLDGLDTVITATGVEMRTLMSRCIIIHVKRAPEGYRSPRFDDAARAVFALGSEKLGAWMAQEVRDGIAGHVPDVPEGLGNRPAALWEPLFAVADRAGGDWPARARQACEELESAFGADVDEEREQDYRSALAAWAASDDGAEDA